MLMKVPSEKMNVQIHPCYGCSRKFIQNVSTENVATISNLSKFHIFILIERQINNDEIMNKIQDKSLSRLDITENKRVDVRKILIMYIY